MYWIRFLIDVAVLSWNVMPGNSEERFSITGIHENLGNDVPE